MDKTFIFRVRALGIIAVLIFVAHFYNGISLSATAFVDSFMSDVSDGHGQQQDEDQNSDIFSSIVMKPEKSILSSDKNRGLIATGNVNVLLKDVDIKACKVPKPSIPIESTQILLIFTLLALIIWLFVKVWGIVGAIGRGKLMDSKTFISLRTIGLMMIVIELLKILHSYLEILHLRSFLQIPGYTIGVRYSLGTLLFGVILMLLGEVLAYSTRIKAEQELTI